MSVRATGTGGVTAVRILAINGSLRRESHNRALLRAAVAVLPPGVELEYFDGLREVPSYDEDRDVEPAPGAVRRLRDAIADADAVLFATPEYNASIPGQLKNALDWASRPFPDNVLRGKPVAVVGASTSMFGAVWAQAELRKVLGAIGARVLDRELRVAAVHEAFGAGGHLLGRDQRERLTEIVHGLTAQVQRDVGLAA